MRPLLLSFLLVEYCLAISATEPMPRYWDIHEAYQQGRLAEARKSATANLELLLAEVEQHRSTEHLVGALPSVTGLARTILDGEGPLEPGIRDAKLLLAIGDLLEKAQEIDALIGPRAPAMVRLYQHAYEYGHAEVVKSWLRVTGHVLPTQTRRAFFDRFRQELQAADIETTGQADLLRDPR